MNKLGIFNQALAAVAHDRYLASTESTFPEAVHCRREWDAARASVLTAHAWGWLAVDIPSTVGAPSPDGANAVVFPRPPDAIRVLGAFDSDGRPLRTRMSADRITVYGAQEASVRYLPDSEAVEDWPPMVQQAVAAALAARIALPLTRIPALAKERAADAALALREAVRLDAAEERHGGDPADRYANARR